MWRHRSLRICLKKKLRKGGKGEERTGLLDVENFHLAVASQQRISGAAHAHALGSEVQQEVGGPGEVSAAISEHADLAFRLELASPSAHHEGVVHTHAPDLINLTRNVFGRGEEEHMVGLSRSGQT